MNCIFCKDDPCGVLVNMLAPSAIDQWFDQTKDYKMCCFFAERAALGSKIKDWLACYQDNLPKWSNMSTRGHLKACWSCPKRTSRSSHRNATCSWHYVDVDARIWRSVEIIDHSLMVQLMHFFHIVE